ncbi:MAG TPA: hypothetical protein PLJ84_10805 [Bacteroidales bacterium]|nr:hypothetical protein [Bacteroidales bacterium]HPT03076.1 hypothetical protein [Bacteroidales bacterium]
MLIIADKRIPGQAKQKLSAFGELMEFSTSGITYDAISGHPDIFFCQTPHGLVAAPNTPAGFLRQLDTKNISYTTGEQPVGNRYPGTAHYNAVVTEKFLIHNASVTDGKLRKLLLTFDILPLTFKQAYTRCNLIPLSEQHFITSDRGIEKVLRNHNLEALYVSPKGIILPGFPNGFFGGCCGVWQDKLFVTGSLNRYAEGEKVRQFTLQAGLQVVELYNGPLFDGGGIFFYD